eukprot:scaffold86246_cov33-Tisochrysis_lutea.AAC.3
MNKAIHSLLLCDRRDRSRHGSWRGSKKILKNSRYLHGARQIADATPNYPPFLPLPLSPPPVLFSRELWEGRPRALLRLTRGVRLRGFKSERCPRSGVRPAPLGAGSQ